MGETDIYLQLGNSIQAARKTFKISQQKLANDLGYSKRLISRLERGQNVGIHTVLKVIQYFGYKIEISIREPENLTVVLGDFDSFYEKTFRKAVELDLHQNPSSKHGITSNDLSGRMKVINWKKASKI